MQKGDAVVCRYWQATARVVSPGDWLDLAGDARASSVVVVTTHQTGMRMMDQSTAASRRHS